MEAQILLDECQLKYKWIDDYCKEKQGVEKDFKVEWQWIRYMINSKMFVSICKHSNGRPIITVKCEPMFGQLMREQHENIVAGHYMNKEHWNSIYLDEDVPESIIKEMIDMSYTLILNSLTKKVQKEITG